MTFLRYVAASLTGAMLLTACSRPVALFQPSASIRYTTPLPTASTPVEVPAPSQDTYAELAVPPVPAQTEAVASLKVGRVEERHLARRVERANARLITKSPDQTVKEAPKLTFVQRLAVKAIDRKIQKRLAPAEKNGSFNYIRLGSIVGLVGLLLLLFGNGLLAITGLVVLIGGLVLMLLSVVNEKQP